VTQYYSYKRFRLDRAPVNTRILITCFYVMMALAVTVGVLNYKVRTGLTPQGTVEWYLGNENAEGEVSELLFAKSVREMLDVTHPHLFEEGIIIFVLCHLFGLTKVRERRKRWVYILSFSAVILDTGMPWLTRFVSSAFAPVHILSTALLTVMFVILMVRPLYEMWWDFDKEERYDWAPPQ
jgi:hypothetical protein